MAVTIEDVESRTLLEQFHVLYKKQCEQGEQIENLDDKIDNETIDRQTADLNINAKIDTLREQIESLGVLFTYKGEVATIQDLPAENNKLGDVWYVDSEQAGYIWIEKNGVEQWEEFGPAIDLSEYAKQEDLEQLQDDVDAMNTQVESNASNIVSLTNTKQDKLTAGTNITIDANNVISASGGSSDAVTLDTTEQTFAGSKVLNAPTGSKIRYKNISGNKTYWIDLIVNENNASKIIMHSYFSSDTGRMFEIRRSNDQYAPTEFREGGKVMKLPYNKEGTLALTSDIDAKVPDAPNTDGTYVLKCIVSNGTKTYQWVAETTPVQTIEFTIAGTTYYAESGMTWSQWVASNYSNNEYGDNGTNIYNLTNSRFVQDTNNNDVASNDIIITNGTYLFGGGGN